MNTKHSAVESGMSAFTVKVARALDAQGYEALWAKGKGGGFWIRGIGYKTLRQSAKFAGVTIPRIRR